MMQDLISRQAAIDAICDCVCGEQKHKCDGIGCWYNEVLMEVPLAATGWIPCSESTPEKDGFYIATLDGEICGEDKPFSGLAEFENDKWVDDEPDYKCVLAWMPLPEPYKQE